MSKLTATFATLVRKAAVGFRQYCDRCNRETWWRLVAEDARNEYYKCDSCGDERGVTVR